MYDVDADVSDWCPEQIVVLCGFTTPQNSWKKKKQPHQKNKTNKKQPKKPPPNKSPTSSAISMK